MKTVCKVTLLGAVGKDPEVRFTGSGMAIASFSLATNNRKKDANGEYQDFTSWHNCVAFGKLGEIVQQYVRKGSKLYAEGTIEYQQYEKDGETKYITKIVLSEISMLSSSNESSLSAQQSHNQNAQQPAFEEVDDDDIPF